MLWSKYVFQNGSDVHELWDVAFSDRPLKLLYIAGHGFDIRAQKAMSELVKNITENGAEVEQAKLLLVNCSGSELCDDMRALTEENSNELKRIFQTLSPCEIFHVDSHQSHEDDLGPSTALREVTLAILSHIQGVTDIILDVSSLPRVVYISLIVSILRKLIGVKSNPKNKENVLSAGGVNFQVIVAEDPILDAHIKAEDPSNELITIPGFASATHTESGGDWPHVWFPLLGENRVAQLEKLISLASISQSAEVCPVLPHPSKNPRRADELLIEYSEPLFKSRRTPATNIILANESNPFEVYRQLLNAMLRYKDSMILLGGCRLIVTPLGSKLMTIGAALACFEVMIQNKSNTYSVAMPHTEPKRYFVEKQLIHNARPTLSVLLLTGIAYSA